MPRPGFAMSGRWTDLGCGGDSSQDFTQATQEESGLGKTLLIGGACGRRGANNSYVLLYSSSTGEILKLQHAQGV